MKHLYRAVFKMDTNALVCSELWVNQRETTSKKIKQVTSSLTMQEAERCIFEDSPVAS